MHTKKSLENFPLDSDQCMLLLTLEETGSVQATARIRGRDVSAMNRQIQKIAETAAVLEKQAGKWVISPLGRALNDWTREALTKQQQVLSRRSRIRIGTNREFAARILAPNLGQLVELNHQHQVDVLTSEDGVEPLLVQGKVDFGIDCGRPKDPLIRFRSVQPEPYSIVAHPRFVAQHRVKGFDDLLDLPYLQYSRASAPQLLQLSRELPWVLARFNDISATRSACLAGLGWTVLPRYCAHEAIASRQLVLIGGPKITPDTYGIWWLRERRSIEGWVTKAVRWLKTQSLE